MSDIYRGEIEMIDAQMKGSQIDTESHAHLYFTASIRRSVSVVSLYEVFLRQSSHDLRLVIVHV